VKRLLNAVPHLDSAADTCMNKLLFIVNRCGEQYKVPRVLGRAV
jgi:hypothetical protein